MRNFDFGTLVLFLITIFVLFILIFGYKSLYEEQQACKNRGGVLLKGFMGYECVVIPR